MSSPQVWFITGASSGLGRAMTEHVLAKGDIAVATMRKPEAVSDISAKYDSTKLLVLKLDVTKPDEIKAAFAKVEATFGSINVVFNNAGYGALGEIEGTPDDVARGVFEVNFWGSTNVAREAVRFFREVNRPGVGGRLISISSMAGFYPMPAIGYYSASKAALQSINEALSKELDPSWNIKVTIIHLGGFATRGTHPDSLVTIPPHPAYLTNPTTVGTRNFINNPAKLRDVTKAVEKLYEVSKDPAAPLHLPLGLDAISLVSSQIESVTADVLKAKQWSADLQSE